MQTVRNFQERHVLLLLLANLACAAGALSVNFYQSTCPNVAAIVTQSINSASSQSNVVPPGILRLFFHDCMVQGCDASILISTTPGNAAERDFSDNQSLRQEGFNAIEQAKQAVESQCPGVVSCADILALAARDVVVFTGGQTWDVPLGRLDGLVSSAAAPQGRLPQANSDVAQLTQSFQAVGLSELDMVILSGSHTIGFAHCNQFSNRLYSFQGSNAPDPSMNPSLFQSLTSQCPQFGGDPSTLVALDPTTSATFDNSYYSDLQQGEGLLFSDQVLFNDGNTQNAVNQLAATPGLFLSNFAQSMIKLSTVLSNQPGNVRQVCSAFNP